MLRVDTSHTENKTPHITSMVERDRLLMLLRQIEHDEIGCREAGQRLKAFPFITGRILSEVQSLMPSNAIRIDDPSHAAAMLGTQRLIALVGEFIPEQVSDPVPKRVA